jgi:hypothetical protein
MISQACRAELESLSPADQAWLLASAIVRTDPAASRAPMGLIAMAAEMACRLSTDDQQRIAQYMINTALLDLRLREH